MSENTNIRLAALQNLYEAWVSNMYNLNEEILKDEATKIGAVNGTQDLSWKWIHHQIHINGNSEKQAANHKTINTIGSTVEREELSASVLSLLRSGQAPNNDMAIGSTLPCIHQCPYLVMEKDINFPNETTSKPGKGFVRTITEFCLTNSNGVHITKPRDAVYVTGLYSTIDMNHASGQRAAMGRWTHISETYWAKVRITDVGISIPPWFRDGTKEVPIIMTKSAHYVLQTPCIQFQNNWRSIGFKPYEFMPLLASSDRPKWADRAIWEEIWNADGIGAESCSGSDAFDSSDMSVLNYVTLEDDDRDFWTSFDQEQTPPLDPGARFYSFSLDLN